MTCKVNHEYMSDEKRRYKTFMKGVMPTKCPKCGTIMFITAKDVEMVKTDNSKKKLKSVTSFSITCPACNKKIKSYSNFKKYECDEKLPFKMRLFGYFKRELNDGEKIV